MTRIKQTRAVPAQAAEEAHRGIGGYINRPAVAETSAHDEARVYEIEDGGEIPAGAIVIGTDELDANPLHDWETVN